MGVIIHADKTEYMRVFVGQARIIQLLRYVGKGVLRHLDAV
jgi:hypothetical protein